MKRIFAVSLMLAALTLTSVGAESGECTENAESTESAGSNESTESAGSGVSLVASEVRPGKGVTEMRSLSDFVPALARTPFDAPVYLLSGAPSDAKASSTSGASDISNASNASNAPFTAAIIAGAHANEIAGVLAAYWIIERCEVLHGRLAIVPRANASGATWSLNGAQAPRLVELNGRTIRYGTRFSNPLQETEPDPEQFIPPLATSTFQPLAGKEARNLNRAYPGLLDGRRTAQTAYAITAMLRAESAHIALDLHEASIDSALTWSIITRKEYLDVAALATLDIEDTTGVTFHLEDSRDEFAGYSHWEWGRMGVAAFLVETPNPAQPKDDPTVDQLHHAKAPLALRVYVHLRAAKALLENASAMSEAKDALVIEGFPSSVEEVSRWLEGI